jgi:hypothetical protein
MSEENETLKIELNSPIFRMMVSTFNMHLVNVLAELNAGNFEEGDINLKLTIDLQKCLEEVQAPNEIGSESKRDFWYKKPVFSHEITSTFKRRNKDKGAYNEQRALQINSEGEFVAVPIKTAQLTMDDYFNGLPEESKNLYKKGQTILNEMAQMAQKN